MTPEAPSPRRKLAAILMVDVAGFSRMMGHNEEGTTALIREFQQRTRGLVEAHQGRVVDTAGDSAFGEFDSVINAMRCAKAIQDEQAALNIGQDPAERMETRIGVHVGDVIVQDYHIYGDGVNIAARLQALAAPGTICVSEAVYQQVYTKLDLAFEDMGVQELKNIAHPIRLYRVTRAPTPGAAPSPSLRGVPLRNVTWAGALLNLTSLVPLLMGVYFLATVVGLPPTRRLLPAFGAVLVGVGLGRILRLRTGRQAFFLIPLGAGLVLAALIGDWRRGQPWWLMAGGIVVIVVGLTRLRSRGPDSGRS